MKKRPFAGLWFYFVSRIFVVLTVTILCISAIGLYIVRTGRLQIEGTMPHRPILILLLISVGLGTIMAGVASGWMSRPMRTINKATKQVAKGDFSVRMDMDKGPREIREMVQSFNTMVQELGSIETLRNDFVQNVSHEFKNPIAAIEGYATLLRSRDLGEEERDEYTKMILYSARSLSKLCGNILHLSKLENQEIVVEKTTFRLDEQIRMSVLMLEREWSKKELDLDINLEELTYTWSEELLSQVWGNLLSNAIKYTPPGGVISIRLQDEGDRVRVIISDTGQGMSAETQRHVFDKFYQGDMARKAEGNGLGLTLVKRIVDLAEGEVSVNSTEGKGSTFSVVLPK